MVWAVGTCFLDLNRIGLGLIFLVFVFYCSQRSEISGQLLSCDLSSDLLLSGDETGGTSVCVI